MSPQTDSKQTCPIWPDCDCPIETDCKALSFATPPGSGGPASAPKASPAAPARDPGGDMSATLKQRGEAILAEMRSVLERSDDALWMIKRELGHRQDLIEAAFDAHVAMGHVQHDLRKLVKDL